MSTIEDQVKGAIGGDYRRLDDALYALGKDIASAIFTLDDELQERSLAMFVDHLTADVRYHIGVHEEDIKTQQHRFWIGGDSGDYI